MPLFLDDKHSVGYLTTTDFKTQTEIFEKTNKIVEFSNISPQKQFVGKPFNETDFWC